MRGRGATQRTGGRSARVREAVHRAVTELLAEQGAEAVTVAEVAERSGVHPTSVYRRWGTRDALILDVAVSRLSVEVPIPDTGTLSADLFAYARQVAANLAQPDGLAFLRALIATAGTAGTDDSGGEHPTAVLAGRAAEMQTMLDRAGARGETHLPYTAVLDGIIAPIYTRHLFRVGGVDDAYLAGLVHKVLTSTVAGELSPAHPPTAHLAGPRPE